MIYNRVVIFVIGFLVLFATANQSKVAREIESLRDRMATLEAAQQ